MLYFMLQVTLREKIMHHEEFEAAEDFSNNIKKGN